MSTIAGYVHVGTCRVSPDHKFLAYTLDITGNEQFLLQVKDLSNGYIVSRSQVDGVVSLAWAQDSTTLFYTVSDENQRPYRQIVLIFPGTFFSHGMDFFSHNFFFSRVLFTKLGSDEIDDVPVFTESNSSFCVDITSTKDGKFITVNSNSRTSSEEGIYLVHFAFLSNDIFISVSDMLRLTSYSVFYRFM